MKQITIKELEQQRFILNNELYCAKSKRDEHSQWCLFLIDRNSYSFGAITTSLLFRHALCEWWWNQKIQRLSRKIKAIDTIIIRADKLYPDKIK